MCGIGAELVRTTAGYGPLWLALSNIPVLRSTEYRVSHLLLLCRCCLCEVPVRIIRGVFRHQVPSMTTCEKDTYMSYNLPYTYAKQNTEAKEEDIGTVSYFL